MEGLANYLQKSKKLAPARHTAYSASDDSGATYMSRGLCLYTMEGLMKQDFPEEQWVLDELIPEGITVISAAPASFKTWILLSIAASIACGTKLFNHFEPSQAGVLMIDEEDNPRLIQKRLRMLGVSESAPIEFMVGQDFKVEPEQIIRIIDFCKDKGIGLITIDSLVRVHDAKENDASKMAEVFAALRRFHKAGINVLVTHHNRKGKSDNARDDMRGSSDIFAAVDCNLAISRKDKYITVKQVKLRTAEEIGDIRLKIESDDEQLRLNFVGVAEPAKSKQTILVDNITGLLSSKERLNQSEINEELKINDGDVNAKTLRTVLKRMVADNDLTEVRGLGNELLYSLKTD